MPISLNDQLVFLFNAYNETKGADPSILGRREEILAGAQRGELVLEDWEVIRGAYREVASTNRETFQEWFWILSRRFGAATHHAHEIVPRRNGTTERQIDPTEVFAEYGVDLLRYGMILFACDLPGKISPPIDEGLRRYLRLPPDLRSYFTDEMLVMEQVLGGIAAIPPEEATPEVRSNLFNRDVEKFLRRAYVDLRDLLFEHDTIWIMLYNSVRNGLWESDQPIPVFRAHINMTSLNEKDSSGRHGDVLLSVVKGWLKEHFPGMVQNPERTSFSFVAPSAARVRAQLTDYSSDIATRLATMPRVDPEVIDSFSPRIVVSERVIARRDLYDYAIKTPDDLDAFAPVIEFSGQLRVDDLKKMGMMKARRLLGRKEPPFERIRGSRDPVVIQTLDALVLKALIGMNGLLAAQTTFFEQREQADLDTPSAGVKGSIQNPVYEEGALPPRGDPLHERWLKAQRRFAGYVGPGQYQPSENPQLMPETGSSTPAFQLGEFAVPGLHPKNDDRLNPLVNHLLRVIPRLERMKGYLSHSREGSRGGLIEQFLARARRLAELPPDAPPSDVADRLEALQEVTRQLLEGYRAFYSQAITDPRNNWTPKQHAVFRVQRGDAKEEVGSNFFLQEVALSGNRHLAALEYDSFKAYQAIYPPLDEVDTDFNRVRDTLFLAARMMNMPDPILKPSGGDHIVISFSNRDHNGQEIDPVAYCRLVQRLVRQMFADRSFHDYHKVDMHQLDLHLPEGLGGFDLHGWAETLMKAFQLSARPVSRLVSGDHLVLHVPVRNGMGQKVPVEKIRRYLDESGLKTELRRDPSVETKRLPMWEKEDRSTDISERWVFSPEKPGGYQPFLRTLTVSMALAGHEPVKTPEDEEGFARTEEMVNRALAQAKAESWPFKEGFIDTRRLFPFTG
ncbi:MAG: hypothetical protein HY541_08165, partial [Deltaproteobacteria bacterium]|nr:hypothetical protein [Deltaproteobacteria bacterium]